MQLSRDLDVQHKTAWVLSHKIREAMSSETASEKLFGIVEVDGAWFGGSVKPENRVEDRKDRRLKEHQTGKRRSVVVMRQRRGRTLTTVVDHESDGVDIIFKTVIPGTEVHADEAGHWDVLATRYPTKRINHSLAYSDNGKNTNQAESFFSRLRLMVAGQHHHVSPQHLGAYARHAAFLEDHRAKDNGALAKRIIGLGLAAPVSRLWKGYWQRAEHNAS